MRTVAAVEMGGTKVSVTVGSHPDDCVEPIVFATTTPDETLARIISELAALRRQRAFDAVGVASFGPLGVDESREGWGWIGPTPKAGWSGADVAGALATLGAPVIVETDVNAAAMGERRWGAGQGASSLAYVTVGTGVGIGLVVEGRPVHGLSHPEAGHVRVRRVPDDPYPGCCPWHGDCLEGLICGPALAERKGVPGQDLSADDAVFALAGTYLGRALASVVLIASPEKIIVGGGVGRRHSVLAAARASLREDLAGYVADLPAEDDLYLVGPGLGDHAGLFGAMDLAQQRTGLQSFA